MKKRMISLLLALVLILSLLPATALAAGEIGELITVNGQKLIYNGTPVTCQFDNGRGSVTWDGETLTLDSVNLKYTDYDCPGDITDSILYEGEDLIIELRGENNILGLDNGIYITGGSLTITGEGSLTVDASDYSINVRGNIAFTGGSVTAKTIIDAANDIIISGDSTYVKADDASSSADARGISAGRDVIISGGTVIASGNASGSTTKLLGIGISAWRHVVISGGTVTATGTLRGSGLQSSDMGIRGRNTVIITGGTVTATGTVGDGINGSNGVFISGGTVTATGGSSGIPDYVTIDPQHNRQITIRHGADNESATEETYLEEKTQLSFSGEKYFHSVDRSRDALKIEVEGRELTGSPENPAVESFGDGTVTWDGAALTLNNATIENKGGSGIYYAGSNAVTIELVGKNSVTGSENGIDIHDLTITGEGSLSVMSEKLDGYNGGIHAYKLNINSGEVTATGNVYGIFGDGGKITISGGTVVVSSNYGYGINIAGSGGNVKITGGTVTIHKGIFQNGSTVYVDPKNGGQITIQYGDDASHVTTETYSDYVRLEPNFTWIKYFHSEYSEGGPNITVGGLGLYGDASAPAYARTDGSGAVTQCSAAEADIIWDGAVLTLDNATIANADGSGILYTGSAPITLKLLGENSVTGSTSGIEAPSIIIAGEGSLSAQGANGSGISGAVTITGASLTATGSTSSISGDVTIDPAAVGAITVQYGESAASTVTEHITEEVSGTYSSKYFHSEVYVPEFSITGVSIEPESAAVEKGGELQFAATVTGTGAYDQAVIWTVTGNEDSRTAITNGGLLVVGDNETAASLTVTATAKGDSGKSASASVAVKMPPNIYIDGVGRYGTPDAPYTSEDGSYTWDGTTLKLNNATINNAYKFNSQVSSSKCASIYRAGHLTIELSGVNNVRCDAAAWNSFGIYVAGDLTIKGDGTLNTTATYSLKHGIYAWNMTIESGTVNSFPAWGNGRGIYTGSITIRGGTLRANGDEYGIGPNPVNVIIDPPEGKLIAVKTGNYGDNDDSAVSIKDSPFSSRTEIQINRPGYFYSYVPQIYTVKFDANGGEGQMDERIFLYDEEQALPACTFAHADAAFVGWSETPDGQIAYTDGAKVKNLTAIDGGTVTLYARWGTTSYNVTLDANGGTINSGSITSYFQGFGAKLPTDVTRTGYIFDGWYDDNGSKVTEIGSDATGDKSYTARWTPVTYTVTFSANGGDGNMDDQTFAYDVEQNLAANTFTRTGYDFAGWSDVPDGNVVYADRDAVKNLTDVDDAVITLYAQWTPITYTVAFNANGGNGEMDSQDFTYGEEQSLSPNTFTRTGYTFAGWSETQDGDVAYSDAESVRNLTSESSGTVTLYAQWTPIIYAVAFNANGGDGEMNSQTFAYGVEQSLAANTFTRTGYDFAGWSDTQDGDVVYADRALVNNLTDVDGTVITLYAKWMPTTYTVAFNANGGDGNMDDQTFAYDVEQSLTANIFTRTGYTFAGWSDTPDGDVAYSDAESVRNLTSESSGTVTLYAQWTPITYTVAFNANGGDGNMDNQTFTYDVEQGLNVNTFARTDATFVGWSETPDGQIAYADGAKVKNLTAEDGGTVTLYARWGTISYNVTLNTDGGTINSGSITSYFQGFGAKLPTDVTRTGYIFDGWYDDNGSKVTEIGSDATGDKSYTACWTPITYTVAFDANGGDGNMDNQTFTYDVEQSLTANAFTRTGYTFAGWSDAPDGDILYADRDAVKNLAAIDGAVVTLYAQWAAKTNPGGVPTYPVTVSADIENGAVYVSTSRAPAGSMVTVTIAPDEGYELYGLMITDRNGNEVKPAKVSDTRYTFKMPTSGVEIWASFRELYTGPLPFTDVAENAWYAEAVRYVYKHGLMDGTSVNTFDPDATTSRAMIATILWRMAGSPVVGGDIGFSDVANGQWYSEAIRWAATEGIVDGYDNGKFGPNDPITREQFAAMLWRYAKSEGYDVSVGENSNILSYTDAADVSEYAIPAIQWACGTGIINGTGDGSTLSPQDAATRAQAAMMLMRFCEK